MDKILLVDYLNLVHRSNIRFGPPEPDKVSYAIVYNFVRSLRAVVEKFEPQKVFVCFEGSKNFRYALFQDYKANRIIKRASSAAKEVDRQRDIITNLLQYLPVTTALADRFEADDVVSALCQNLKNEEVIILSSDSDFIQLLQNKEIPNVKLFNPALKDFVSPPSHHYLGCKILAGDKKTDNIPGLMSLKKATEMIQNPKLLEEFLSVEENRAAFNLNKKLIELAPIPENELILTDGNFDLKALREEFARMEFKTILTDKYWATFSETFGKL